MAVLYPFAVAPVEIRATDEFYNDDLRPHSVASSSTPASSYASANLYFVQAPSRCCAWKSILQTSVSSVLDVLELCYKRFIWMLQKVDQDVAYVLVVLQAFVPNVLSVF
jgi:hypothetical protein